MFKRFRKNSAPGDNANDTTTKGIGDRAERQAEAFLLQHGLSTLERNYRSKVGEVDLIMKHRKSLVFVEVRYRKNTHFGSGSDTVDNRKQHKLILAAQYYLQQHRLTDAIACRFDVVSITGNLDNPHFDWLQNAFSA